MACVGFVVLAVGMMGEVVDNYVSIEPHLNMLEDTHGYFTQQSMALENIKQGHIQNVHATNAAIEGLLTQMTAKSKKFKEGDAPALKNGVGQLKANSE